MKLPIRSTVPSYVCQLPSTDERVEYRPYLMKEYLVMMMANESNDPEQVASAVRNLLTACTYNKLDIAKLPIFDLEYLYLMVRAKSRGEEIKLNIRCNAVNKEGVECGHSNVVNFNLISNVKIKRTETHSKKVMLTDTTGIIMTYPDISGLLNKSEDETSTKKYESLMSSIVQNIETIFDEENECSVKDYPMDEIRSFIEGLTEQQFAKIREFFDTMPKVVGEVSFTCKKCGAKHKNIEITGLQDFLE